MADMETQLNTAAQTIEESKQPAAQKPATPTTEQRVSVLEANYEVLMKKLRKSIAFFDRK